MSTNIKSIIWVLYFSFWPCQIPSNFALPLCGCCGPATELPSPSLPWLLITYSPNWPLKGQIIAGSSAQVYCPGVLLQATWWHFPRFLPVSGREGVERRGGEGRTGEGDVAPLEHATGHLLAVAGDALHHLVGRLEAGAGDLSKAELLMVDTVWDWMQNWRTQRHKKVFGRFASLGVQT